jgi:hypothetical protein
MRGAALSKAGPERAGAAIMGGAARAGGAAANEGAGAAAGGDEAARGKAGEGAAAPPLFASGAARLGLSVEPESPELASWFRSASARPLLGPFGNAAYGSFVSSDVAGGAACAVGAPPAGAFAMACCSPLGACVAYRFSCCWLGLLTTAPSQNEKKKKKKKKMSANFSSEISGLCVVVAVGVRCALTACPAQRVLHGCAGRKAPIVSH